MIITNTDLVQALTTAVLCGTITRCYRTGGMWYVHTELQS
jgi:hypothetical protein